MDEIMIEAQITRPEEDISDNIEKVEAAFSHAEAAIKESKANRENENVFDGYMLENAKGFTFENLSVVVGKMEEGMLSSVIVRLCDTAEEAKEELEK